MEGPCSWYWSSSPVEDIGDDAFRVRFYNGYVRTGIVSYDNAVRCVR